MEYFASPKKTIAAALLALAAIAFSLPVFADSASHHYLCSNIANVTVKCSDGKNYSLDCTIPFASQTATYTATSYVGYKFLGWYRPVAAFGYYTTSPDFELYTEKVTTNLAFKPADYFLAATCVLHVAGDTPGLTALFMAKYEALEKYSITYNLNGGTNPSSAPTYYYHEIGATLPTPTRTGYTFGGWYVKSDFSGTKQTTIPTTDTGAKTYYAKWTANTYAITYTLNSGTNPTGAPTSYTYGVGATLPTPTRTGYTFGGWYTTSTFSGEAQTTISKTATGAKTYYAKWTAITYKVRFYANLSGASGSMSDQSMTYNTAVELTKNAYSVTGYTFAGWATRSDGAVDYKDAASVKNLTSTNQATVSLYAKWTANTYTVTFRWNDGSQTSQTRTVAYLAQYGAAGDLPTPTRAGYEFRGWYTAATSGSQVESTTIVQQARDHDLYAHWAARKYTVTFDANGGSVSTSSIKVTFDETYGYLPTPTNEGYRFIGWYTDKTGGRLIEGATTVSTASDQTLYARWAANTYTVRFYSNDGTGYQSEQALTYNQEEALQSVGFTRTGYRFLGWATVWNGSVVYKNEAKVKNLAARQDAVVSLYACWQAQEYAITATCTNGTIVAPSTAHFDESVTLLWDPEGLAGYNYTFDSMQVFSGESEGRQLLATYTGGSGTTTYRLTGDVYYPEIIIVGAYLKTPKTFTVYFDAEGGEIATRQKTVTYDSTYGDLGTPTRAGYTFAGWWTADGDEVTAETTVKILSNQTLYAHWRYQVAFAKGVNDDSVSGTMTNITAECGKSFTLPANGYSRVGYRFGGWLSGKTLFADGAEVTKDLPLADGVAVLTAQWEPIKYKISFDANWFTPGTLQTPILTNVVEKSYAVACSLPKWSPVNTLAEKFLGWAASPTGKVLVTDGGTLTEDLSEGDDVTLYAIWQMPDMTLSEAVGCTNLVLKSAKSEFGAYSSIAEKWTVNANGVGIQSGTITFKGMSNPALIRYAYSELTAVLVNQPGRLTFTWRARTAKDGLCEFCVNEVPHSIATTDETTVVYTNTVADQTVALSWRAHGDLENDPTPSNLVITSLMWEPLGEHPEPTEEDRPVIGSDFTFATSPDFDYVIKCATTLANGGNWTQYGNVITGKGEPVPLPIPPLGDAAGEGASRYGCKFFKVEVIQRGSK